MTYEVKSSDLKKTHLFKVNANFPLTDEIYLPGGFFMLPKVLRNTLSDKIEQVSTYDGGRVTAGFPGYLCNLFPGNILALN